MLTMLLLAAVSATAHPQTKPGDLSALFGNTLVTVDGGIESHFYYKADHTFTGTVPMYHFDLKGRWNEKPDGTVCRIFDPPIPKVHNPDCGLLTVHTVGETHTFDDGDSQSLVPGVQ